jgi:UDP-glucose 4-epimerase
MHKILIVGGGGFIGKNLANYLVLNNYDVTIFGNVKETDLKFLNNEIRIVNVKIQIDDYLIHEISSATVIIWLAHSLVPGVSVDDELDYVTNILPVIKAFEINKQKSIPARFIYISTGGAIYGNVSTCLPIKEDLPVSPISQYGISKKKIEEDLKHLSLNSKIECIVLRPSNVYGRLQNMSKPQGIIGFAIKSILLNTSLVLYNEGKQIRDFLHINDFCEAVMCVIAKDYLLNNYEVFNVSSGQPVSIIDIIKKLEQLAGKYLKLDFLPARQVDTDYAVLDNGKFSSTFSWKCKVELNDGLEDLLRYYKAELS